MPSQEEKPGAAKWPVWIPIGVSLISLIIAIASWIGTNSALEEERATTVTGSARADPTDESLEGFPIRLALINESLRPIVVSGFSLRIDGIEIGRAQGYFADTRVLDQADLNPDRLPLERRSLPFVIEARSSANIAALFDLQPQLKPGSQRTDGARDFCQAFVAAPEASEAEHRIRIWAKYEPQGSIRIPVRLSPGHSGRYAWFAQLRGSPSAPSAMDLSRKLTDAASNRTVQLSIWRRDRPGIAREVTRPLRGSTSTRFPFRGLGEGGYVWAAETEGETVAIGAFEVPLENDAARSSPFPAYEPQGACEKVNLPEYIEALGTDRGLSLQRPLGYGPLAHQP